MSRLGEGEGPRRAALVRCIARLARHAAHTELVRTRDVLVRFVGLLADPTPEVPAPAAPLRTARACRHVLCHTRASDAQRRPQALSARL